MTATDNLTFDRHDLGAINQAFAEGHGPSLSDLSGFHRAELIGPPLVRLPAPLFLATTGMPFWWGKNFDEVPADGTESLAGRNILSFRGRKRRSISSVAEVGPSRIDGRPEITVRYPKTAPWPWRNVTDHLRQVQDGVILGITFGIPGAPATGAPFLLRPEPGPRPERRMPPVEGRSWRQGVPAALTRRIEQGEP